MTENTPMDIDQQIDFFDKKLNNFFVPKLITELKNSINYINGVNDNPIELIKIQKIFNKGSDDVKKIILDYFDIKYTPITNVQTTVRRSSRPIKQQTIKLENISNQPKLKNISEITLKATIAKIKDLEKSRNFNGITFNFDDDIVNKVINMRNSGVGFYYIDQQDKDNNIPFYLSPTPSLRHQEEEKKKQEEAQQQNYEDLSESDKDIGTFYKYETIYTEYSDNIKNFDEYIYDDISSS